MGLTLVAMATVCLVLQGSRACPGKLQRRGRYPELKCHKIDLDELSHLDVLSLKEYLTEDGEIIPKKGTGLCSKCQRQVRSFWFFFVRSYFNELT